MATLAHGVGDDPEHRHLALRIVRSEGRGHRAGGGEAAAALHRCDAIRRHRPALRRKEAGGDARDMWRPDCCSIRWPDFPAPVFDPGGEIFGLGVRELPGAIGLPEVAR
jgi:hypothetical protein